MTKKMFFLLFILLINQNVFSFPARDFNILFKTIGSEKTFQLDDTIESCLSVLGEPKEKLIFSYPYHDLIVLSYDAMELFFLSAKETRLAKIKIYEKSDIYISPLGTISELTPEKLTNTWGAPRKQSEFSVSYLFEDEKYARFNYELVISYDENGEFQQLEWTSDGFYL